MINFYKDSNNAWYVNGAIVPSCSMILSWISNSVLELKSIYEKQDIIYSGDVTGIVKKDGSRYADKEEFLSLNSEFFITPASGGGGIGGAVDSVNGKTGVVVLNKGDIGLGSVKNVDTTNPSNILQDQTHRFLTESDQSINGVKTFTSIPVITVASDPTNYELTPANYVNRLNKYTNDKLDSTNTKVANLETKTGEQQISITNLTNSKANKLTGNTVSILESTIDGDLHYTGKVFNNNGETSNDVWTADKLINYINSKVVGLWEWRGGFDISSGVLPTDKVEKGDVWLITKEGTVQGKLIKINSLLIANEDNPLQDLSKWSIRQPDLDYVAENVINKEKLALDDSEDKYPCNKVVKKAIKDITLTKDNFATINGISVLNDNLQYPTSFNLEPKINKAQFDESYFDGTKVWKQFKDVDIIKKYRTLESVGMNQVGKTYSTSEFIQLLMNKTVNEPSIKE